MTLTFDGTTLIFDGTVTLTNATDVTTGVATLLLTANSGFGSLPALVAGTPGLPPVIDSVSVTQVPYGTSVTAPVLTLVSAGGAGVASHYTLAIQVNSGQQGTTGSTTIGSATDIEGTATDQYTIKWVAADSKYKIVGQLCGDTFNTTTFTTYGPGNASGATLTSLTVAAQPFAWRPRVSGFAIPTGTANTHVDLLCRLNNASTGDIVGYGYGVTGAGSTGIPAWPVTLNQSFGGVLTGSYGKVSQGSAATLYFLATQTASTTDNWTAPAATMSFTVKVDPVPGTNN